MAESPPGGARATAVSAGTAETLVLFIPSSGQTGPQNVNDPFAIPAIQNLIRGSMNITIGSATAPILRCRRGNGVGGSQVGTSQALAAASGNVPIAFQDANAPPSVGYTITISTTTAALTVNEIVASADDGT